MQLEEDAVIRVIDVAAMLHVARETVYDMARRGEIPCRRAGKRFIIPRAAFMEWLNAGVDTDAGAVLTKAMTRARTRTRRSG